MIKLSGAIEVEKNGSCCAPSPSMPERRSGSGLGVTFNRGSRDVMLARMRPLPGGDFLMGSNNPEGFSQDDEGPVRPVFLDPFSIDIHTVTPFRRRAFLCFILLTFASGCFVARPTAAEAQTDHWVGTWAAAPVALPNDKDKFGHAATTFREIEHISLGGSAVRIVVSNELGLDPLTVGAASIALASGGSRIDLASTRALTFDGQVSVTIPPGALMISDPTDLKVPSFADLAVSLFLPAQSIRQVSQHPHTVQTNYEAWGNVVSAGELQDPAEIFIWPFLKGIDVRAGPSAASIVALGDSITNGTHSTLDANARWPDVLARRLQMDKSTAQLGVLNEGIGGNRILHDVMSASALARFDRDVLAQAGIKYLIILEGINDIGDATDARGSNDLVTAEDLIHGLRQLTTRAHLHGIKVIGATLTPYGGSRRDSPAGEAMREALNHWIRTTNLLDGCADFDKATRDPASPKVYLPTIESPDHIHPDDHGYKIMGDSIDLKLFSETQLRKDRRRTSREPH